MPLRITLGQLLHDCAARFGERPCITMAPSGETLSYAGLESLVNRAAHGFRDGIAGGRLNAGSGHVAVMLENGIPYLAMSYALKKIDLVEVSINRAFRGPALGRMINLTSCETLLSSPAHFDALADISGDLPHLRVLIVTAGAEDAAARFPHLEIISFDSLLANRDDHIVSAAADTDTAVVMFTSGTTGVSKGCLLSHRYAVRTAENMIGPFRITADDVAYTPYPLPHIGPAFYDILPTLMTGGRVVLRDGFSLSNFWPEVVRFGVTWFMCLGSVKQLLYAAPPCPDERLHKVTRCWSTPAPVPKADFDRRFGLHLIPGGGYGSTDAGWVVVPQWDHPGGIVLPHYEVAIVDENDDLLPPGEYGEMVIRPREPGVMADGYFGMPEKTLETRRNPHLHTPGAAVRMSRRFLASNSTSRRQSGHEATLARSSVFLVSDRSSGAYCKLISLKYTQIRDISKTRASQRMTPRIVARTSRSARGRRARSRAMAATVKAASVAAPSSSESSFTGVTSNASRSSDFGGAIPK